MDYSTVHVFDPIYEDRMWWYSNNNNNAVLLALMKAGQEAVFDLLASWAEHPGVQAKEERTKELFLANSTTSTIHRFLAIYF
jgi:hypothetical protein